jgi:protoporphyrinogen oxidase
MAKSSNQATLGRDIHRPKEREKTMKQYLTKVGTKAEQMTTDATLRTEIKAQPGYRSGMKMRVLKVEGRKAYRLYVAVASRWVDGSLADMKAIEA